MWGYRIACVIVHLFSATCSLAVNLKSCGLQNRPSLHATLNSDELLSIPEAVVSAKNYESILEAINRYDVPGAESKAHLKQYIHQQKRQKTAENGIKRIAKFVIGVSSANCRQNVVDHPHFEKLCACALSPLTDMGNIVEINQKDFSSYVESLKCLSCLSPLPDRIINAHIRPLVERMGLASKASSTDRSFPIPAEISALHRVCSRLGLLDFEQASQYQVAVIEELRENLDLPFKILDQVVPGLSIQELRRQVQFQADTIVTRDGKSVKERRETCWMADAGIGGLAYSGKIMRPVPFSLLIADVRNDLERITGLLENI